MSIDVGPIAVGGFGVAPSGCVGGICCCCWTYALDEIGVPPVVAAAAVDPWLDISFRSDTANGLSFSTERRRQSSGRTVGGEFVNDVGVGIACADDWAVWGVLGVCDVDDCCPAADATFVSNLILPSSVGSGGSACFRDTAPMVPPFGWPPSTVVAAGLTGTTPSEDEKEVRGVARLDRPTSLVPLPPTMRSCRGEAMAESLELPVAPSEDRMSDSPADEAE